MFTEHLLGSAKHLLGWCHYVVKKDKRVKSSLTIKDSLVIDNWQYVWKSAKFSWKMILTKKEIGAINDFLVNTSMSVCNDFLAPKLSSSKVI